MRALPLLFQEYEPRTLREVVKLEILTQVCWYRVEGLGLWSNPLRGFFGWGAVGDRRDNRPMQLPVRCLSAVGHLEPCVDLAFTGHPRPSSKTKHLPRYRSVRCHPIGMYWFVLVLISVSIGMYCICIGSSIQTQYRLNTKMRNRIQTQYRQPIQTQYRPILHEKIGLYWVSNTDQSKHARPVMSLLRS